MNLPVQNVMLSLEHQGGLIIMSEKAKLRQDEGGFWVYLRWQGKRHYITTYLGIISFRDNEALARKAKDVIDSEIDKGIFRPERWKRKAKKLFTVRGYSKTWLDQIEPSISTATIYDYRNSFQKHINPIIGAEYIEDLNKAKLTTLLNSIKRAPKGKKNVMDALKQMLRDAYESGHIPQIPIFPKLTGKNKIVKPEIRWIEANEQFKIIQNIPSGHRFIYTFIMLTGCRPSEARAFRKVDIKKSHIIYAVTFGRKNELKEVKGKKIMPFPLTEALKELFASMPKSLGSWAFINPNTGEHYSKTILNDIFREAAKKAGLNISLTEFGRKSFAMGMLQQLDKGIVSHLLRHQDPRMIDHYAEYQTAPLKSALDKVQMIREKEKHELK